MYKICPKKNDPPPPTRSYAPACIHVQSAHVYAATMVKVAVYRETNGHRIEDTE